MTQAFANILSAKFALQVKSLKFVLSNLYHRVPLSYVTGFAKRGLPHTLNIMTLAIHNIRHVTAIILQFLQ